MIALFAPDEAVNDRFPDSATPVEPSPPLAPVRGEISSLYRKYRPQSFNDDELVGQPAIVRTLRNAIKRDRVAHAYLFCGPRGTGKTTTARILAKAVNCEDPAPEHRPCNHCRSCRAIASGGTSDVVEIDAASNRGIDDIRDLRDRVRYAPTQLRVKFYIVDEAHQITGAAANAFLKTLEEPPAHTKFVLATTDPEELLPTIVSRCQRFDFRRIGTVPMIARLRTVATAERIAILDDALAIIARHAAGSLRDALGLLDQLSLHHDDDTPIAANAVLELVGVSRNETIETLTQALADRDPAAALAAVNIALESGADPRALNRQLVSYLRLLLHRRAGGGAEADETGAALADRFSLPELATLALRFAEIDASIKHSPYPQLPLEVALVEGACRASAAVTQSPPATISAAPLAAAPDRTNPANQADEERSSSPGRPPGPSLRDRVRNTASPPVAVARTPTQQQDETGSPLSITPLAPASPSVIVVANPPASIAPVAPSPSAFDRSGPNNGAGLASFDIERLAELWPRIRQDVKAVNRRVEALLSSVDPVSIAGTCVTLATAYEFHRDKLNGDEFRAVVESAISRLVGGPVMVTAVLRGAVTTITPPPPTLTSTMSAGTPLDHELAVSGEAALAQADNDEQRLRAAKNIFDAEEFEPEDPAST